MATKRRVQFDLREMFLTMAVVGCMVAIGKWAVREPPPNGGLVVHRSSLNFGDVLETNRLAWQVDVHNPTDRTISISGFEYGCDCSIWPDELTIAAGGKAAINLELNLTPRDPSVRTDRRHHRWRIAPVIVEQPRQQAGWEIRGTSRRLFSLPSHVISFPRPLVRSDPLPSQTIVLTSFTQLQSLVPQCDPKHGLASVCELDPAGWLYKLSVTPSEALPNGQFYFPVLLRATTPAGAVSEVEVRVSGKVQ